MSERSIPQLETCVEISGPLLPHREGRWGPGETRLIVRCVPDPEWQRDSYTWTAELYLESGPQIGEIGSRPGQTLTSLEVSAIAQAIRTDWKAGCIARWFALEETDR